jgi:ADP-ribosylglycohydrolase
MISDDTEHVAMTAQALITSAGEPDAFARALAREMKRWVLLLPAGAGKATLSAAFRLLCGVSPDRSGVYSAGNGPAMRAAILGVAFGDDLARLRQLVRASSHLTHTDPKAEQGALVVALAAHRFATGRTDALGLITVTADALKREDSGELLGLLDRVAESVAKGEETHRFAEHLGLRDHVTGYIFHTVPVALHAALRHPDDLRAAILACIACGGDTDTTAAIAGGIVGANVGSAGIPADWREGVRDAPRSVEWLERLALRLNGVIASGRPQEPLPLSVPALALRNLGFFSVVLYHGLRRVLPPY